MIQLTNQALIANNANTFEKADDAKNNSSNNVSEINSLNDYVELMKNPKVVIDAYAHWCGPCKRLAPIFAEASKEMTGVKFARFNVDQNFVLPHEIRALPTLLFFKEEKLVATEVGAPTKNQLIAKIKKHLLDQA